MRLGRWLLAVAIIFISIAVGEIYVQRKALMATEVPDPPKPLEKGAEGLFQNGSIRKPTAIAPGPA